MNRIFVDLEMNRIWNRIPDTKVNCEMEIIQIGAVKLDESAREIDCFDEYVKPVCSDSMDRNIERITGIHFNMLAGKEPIEIVLTRFVEWCGKDYEIYSWSETDAHQLVRETGYKGIRDTEGLRYMYCQWHDYQAEFCDTLGLSQRPALEKAVNIAGIEYSGLISAISS